MDRSEEPSVGACVVCGGPIVAFDRADVLGTPVAYAACERCGLVQQDPMPTSAELDAYYTSAYREGRGDADGTQCADVHDRRAEALRVLVAGSPERHLDVGCSIGALLTVFAAPAQVGVEPDDLHRAQAGERGIEVHRSVEDLVATAPEPFDLITMSQVLEHVPDPVAMLRTLRSLLHPDGLLVIEVPSLYRSRAYEPAHVLAFTSTTLASTLAAGGFEVRRRSAQVAHQGGDLGRARNLAVVAVPAAEQAPSGSARVPLIRLGRRVGFLAQVVPARAARLRRRVRARLAR